jgi:hypothetical protein
MTPAALTLQELGLALLGHLLVTVQQNFGYVAPQQATQLQSRSLATYHVLQLITAATCRKEQLLKALSHADMKELSALAERILYPLVRQQPASKILPTWARLDSVVFDFHLIENFFSNISSSCRAVTKKDLPTTITGYLLRISMVTSIDDKLILDHSTESSLLQSLGRGWNHGIPNGKPECHRS